MKKTSVNTRKIQILSQKTLFNDLGLRLRLIAKKPPFKGKGDQLSPLLRPTLTSWTPEESTHTLTSATRPARSRGQEEAGEAGEAAHLPRSMLTKPVAGHQNVAGKSKQHTALLLIKTQFHSAEVL